MNATRHDLELQFRHAVDNGWLPIIQREAKRAGITTAHKLGIESRETNLKNIRGDFRGGIYHGYGIEQVDIGTDPAYCRAWTPSNVEGGIMGGTKIFLSKIADTRATVGKKVIVKGHAFTGKAIEQDDLLRITTAAYNCGRWAYYHFSRNENVDSTTTGHDYSRDVYDRAVEFADILQKAGLEQNAVALTLEEQGKYARKEAQARFGHSVAADRVKTALGEPQEAQDEVAQADYGRDETDSAASPTPTMPDRLIAPDASAINAAPQAAQPDNSQVESPAPPPGPPLLIESSLVPVTAPVIAVPAVSAAPSDTPASSAAVAPEGELTKIGNKANALYTTFGTMIAGAIAWFSSTSGQVTLGIIGAVVVSGVVYMGLQAWRQTSKDKREAQARKDAADREQELVVLREKHAQEVQLFTLKAAATEGMTAVTIVPSPPSTELPNSTN